VHHLAPPAPLCRWGGMQGARAVAAATRSIAPRCGAHKPHEGYCAGLRMMRVTSTRFAHCSGQLHSPFPVYHALVPQGPPAPPIVKVSVESISEYSPFFYVALCPPPTRDEAEKIEASKNCCSTQHMICAGYLIVISCSRQDSLPKRPVCAVRPAG
jgi:hypothetical protein